MLFLHLVCSGSGGSGGGMVSCGVVVEVPIFGRLTAIGALDRNKLFRFSSSMSGLYTGLSH